MKNELSQPPALSTGDLHASHILSISHKNVIAEALTRLKLDSSYGLAPNAKTDRLYIITQKLNTDA